MTPVTLPAISFGAMTFGDQVGPDEARRMVGLALDRGVTLFDTADSYHDGASEEILGQCLADLEPGAEVEVLVASKVGMPVGGDPTRAGLAPERIRASADASLARLGIDHLDIYYLHQPDRSVPLEDSLGAMDDLVTAGKVRSVGVSNHAAWQLADLDAIAASRGWARPVASQVLYNVVSRRIDDEYAELAAVHDLQTTVYNPLAGGLLTGKHRREHIPTDGRFARERYRDRYWSAGLFEAVERLAGVARGAGLSLTELALRWVCSRPVVDSVLLGASSLAQLEANLDACDQGPLPDDVLEACDGVWAQIGGLAPRYNR